jgi:hypothetical protein
VKSLVTQIRQDLGAPSLHWHVIQQPPTDDKAVNAIDVTAEFERILAGDEHLTHRKVFDLPKQELKLVIDAPGIVWLGERIARQE